MSEGKRLTSKSTENVYHLDLERNAYDFLEISFDFFIRARADDEKYWKHALLNLTFAIELMVKERLRREHHLVLLHSLDQFQIISRESRTASWSRAIERLRLVLGERFEKLDAGRLALAQRIRNQILHYDVLLEFPSAFHDFANLINFAREFFRTELANSSTDSLWDHVEINPKYRDKVHDDLSAAFAEDITFYNNMFIPNELMNAIIEEQKRREITLNGEKYLRIHYGDEHYYKQHGFDNLPCGDCRVIGEQIHLFGCDIETCPRCRGQLLTCYCEKDYTYDKESSDHINTLRGLVDRMAMGDQNWNSTKQPED